MAESDQVGAEIDALRIALRQTFPVEALGNGLLYHYTSAQGLLGILRSKSLWLTDTRFLNDSAEIRFGLNFVLKALDNWEKIEEGDDFADCLASYLRGPLMRQLLLFVFSLSGNRDDLPQWRAYGNNARGFALGLRLRQPGLKVLYFNDEAAAEEAARVVKVIINKAEGCAVRLAERAPARHAEWATRILQECAVEVMMFCLAVKHEAFSNEAESRCVIPMIRPNLPTPVKVRENGGRLIPYLEGALTFEQSAVEEVWIGPAADRGAEDAVELLLRDIGFGLGGVDARVRLSTISYRPLVP